MYKLIQPLWQKKIFMKNNTNVVFLVNWESQFLLLNGSEMILFSLDWVTEKFRGRYNNDPGVFLKLNDFTVATYTCLWPFGDNLIQSLSNKGKGKISRERHAFA